MNFVISYLVQVYENCSQILFFQKNIIYTQLFYSQIKKMGTFYSQKWNITTHFPLFFISILYFKLNNFLKKFPRNIKKINQTHLWELYF